jgi:PTH1 family peptidyl-tRNA hydrolase
MLLEASPRVVSRRDVSGGEETMKHLGKTPPLPALPGFLILGLGNPGERYATTRHSFGHRAVDAVARAAGCRFRAGAGPVLICPFTAGADRGILAKSRTYMNRSGIPARYLRDRFPTLDLARWLVVVDDLDLPVGSLRFRRRGSAGGHRGLRAVIAALGSEDFPRLRLGIGRPAGADREDVVDYVLEGFAPDEAQSVTAVLERAVKGIEVFATAGIDDAMNECNAA